MVLKRNTMISIREVSSGCCAGVRGHRILQSPKAQRGNLYYKETKKKVEEERDVHESQRSTTQGEAACEAHVGKGGAWDAHAIGRGLKGRRRERWWWWGAHG